MRKISRGAREHLIDLCDRRMGWPPLLRMRLRDRVTPRAKLARRALWAFLRKLGAVA